MAEKKITELTRLADIKDLDLLAGVNTKNDETVKMTAGDLRAFILAGDGTGEVVTSVTEGTQSGTIAVNGEDVFVKDIKSAAFSDRSEFDLAGSANKALEDANIHTDTEIQTVNTRVDSLETSLTERINQAEENTTQLETTLTEEIDTIKTELTEDINTAKSDLTDSINKVETDLTNNISALETDVNTRMDQIETTTKEYTDQAETNAKAYSDEQLAATITALKISDIPNDTGFITNAVDSLVNYYKKSETYTQAEVNELIAKINSFEILIVEELPTEDINDHAIYFVIKAGEGNDFYEEYIYVNNTWEYVGNTIIDLSGKADVEDVEELQNQIDTINSNLNTKANQSSLDTLQTQVNNIDAEMAEKAAQSSLDALQSEVDSLESVIGTKVTQEDFNNFQTQVNDTFDGNKAMGNIKVDDIECKNILNAEKIFDSYKTSTNLYTFSIDNFYYNSIYTTPEELGIERGIDYTFSMNIVENESNIENICGIVAFNGSEVLYECSNSAIITGETSFTFNLPSNTTNVELRINRYANLTTNTIKISNIQIEKGLTATKYIPYKKFGYNENESMGKIVVDSVRSKNLLPCLDSENITLVKHFIFDELLSIDDYTLSVKDITSSGDGSSYLFEFVDINNTSQYVFLSNNILTTTFTTSNKIKDVYIYSQNDYASSLNVTTTFNNIMLEKGTQATSYVPYKKFGYNSQETLGIIIVDNIKNKNIYDQSTMLKIGITAYGGSTEGWFTNLSTQNTISFSALTADMGDFFPFQIVLENLEPQTYYTISCKCSHIHFDRCYLYSDNLWGTNLQAGNIDGFTFYTGNHKKLILGLYSDTNVVGEIRTISDFQIEKGQKATAYTPYKKFGYNNIDTMGEIVVDDIESKNKFNFDALTISSGALNYTNKTITVRQFANASEQTLKGNSNFIHLFGTSTNWMNGTTYVVTQEDLDNGIAVYGNYEVDADVVISEIQIEEGSTITKYTPYIDFNATGHTEQINNLYNNLFGTDIYKIDSCDSFTTLRNYIYTTDKQGKICGGGVGDSDNTNLRILLGNPNIGAYVMAICKPIYNYIDGAGNEHSTIEIIACNIFASKIAKGWLMWNSDAEYWTGWTYQSRNTTISTSEPSGGRDGDIWIKYTE